MKPSTSKHVALVGAGPGAADLITRRGWSYLIQADCILHDALVSQALLDEIRAHNPAVKLIAVGKRCGRLSTAQVFINKQLIDAIARYPRVVRLKGGDPMLFGRADEEMQALRAQGIHFEVVPGITAALAAASQAQVSLTLRGTARAVTLITPAVGVGEQAHAIGRAAELGDTLAVYMGLKQTQVWAADLLAHGLDPQTPALIAYNVSLPNEKLIPITLGLLAKGSGNTIAAVQAAELMAEQTTEQSAGPCLVLIGKAMAAYARTTAQIESESCLQRLG